MEYYPPNLYCKWLITVPEGKVVKLTFERVIIDGGCRCRTDRKCLGPCECDFVQVQWVARNYIMVRRKYCGYLGEAKRQYNDLPDAIVSRYGNMTVIFFIRLLITAVLRLLSKLWIHQTVGRSIV